MQSLNMNPEIQIITQCAITSGGEPSTFVTCAGGQLSAREIDKCFTHGVGGNSGCFGRNNDIVRHLRQIGVNLNFELGPNHFLVQNWNRTVADLEQNATREAARAVQNVTNEIERASDRLATNAERETSRALKNTEREIRRVVPRVRVKW
jgi:hypothetical protein